MRRLSALALAGVISLVAHEAFHVGTARLAGGKNIELRLSPFYEHNGDRRTLFYTTWTGGRTEGWGESDEAWAWTLQVLIFVGAYLYLRRN